MALTINTNLQALNASNNLTRTFGALSTSVARLSSGLRINGANDDAAGLAVRELMRSDVAVLRQGIRNANDGIGMLQTMDGAAGVIDEKLIRMKELAEQASTDTYSSAQRTIMNSEFDQMRSEITRIATATDFNSVKMLNTSNAVQQTLVLAGDNGISSNGSAATLFGDLTPGSSVTFVLTTHSGRVLTTSLTVNSATTITAVKTAINSMNSVGATWDSTNELVISDDICGASSLNFKVIKNNVEYETASVLTSGAAGNVTIHFGTGDSASEDYYAVNKYDMTATGLGISSNNISDRTAAMASLTAIDAAINTKDTARAHFGAMINRLSNTVTNLTIQAENIQAAESRISDVDVATEMTKFLNNQIKANAAVSMLAQANSLPQMALNLLGG